MEDAKSEYKKKVKYLSEEFGGLFENSLKKLLKNNYECMAECYETHEEVKKASHCAKICYSNVENAIAEIDAEVAGLLTSSKACTFNCRLTNTLSPDYLPSCYTKCYQALSLGYKRLNLPVLGIIDKYL